MYFVCNDAWSANLGLYRKSSFSSISIGHQADHFFRACDRDRAPAYRPYQICAVLGKIFRLIVFWLYNSFDSNWKGVCLHWSTCGKLMGDRSLYALLRPYYYIQLVSYGAVFIDMPFIQCSRRTNDLKLCDGALRTGFLIYVRYEGISSRFVRAKWARNVVRNTLKTGQPRMIIEIIVFSTIRIKFGRGKRGMLRNSWACAICIHSEFHFNCMLSVVRSALIKMHGVSSPFTLPIRGLEWQYLRKVKGPHY